MHECKTVTLRTRPLKGRMMSFYLDYYPGYSDYPSISLTRQHFQEALHSQHHLSERS